MTEKKSMPPSEFSQLSITPANAETLARKYYDIKGKARQLVTDRESLAPATYLANRMREKRVLMSTDGPYDNVLKIKPPIVFGRDHADLLCDTLHDALTRCATR